jgi:uncharacterized protein YdeI (YjbR/CyaY-like superfamily)
MEELMEEMKEVAFMSAARWEVWLRRSHASSPGVWLVIATRGSGAASVTYDEAVDCALCHGWIDGQKRGRDETAWLQRFTPRGPRSIWSRRNRERAERLNREGRMEKAGPAEVERARQDGRWDRACDSQKNAEVPDELRAALARNPRARAFFATLTSTNRCAIPFRLQTAKKPETRARRLATFVEMLNEHRTVHP